MPVKQSTNGIESIF